MSSAFLRSLDDLEKTFVAACGMACLDDLFIDLLFAPNGESLHEDEWEEVAWEARGLLDEEEDDGTSHYRALAPVTSWQYCLAYRVMDESIRAMDRCFSSRRGTAPVEQPDIPQNHAQSFS